MKQCPKKCERYVADFDDQYYYIFQNRAYLVYNIRAGAMAFSSSDYRTSYEIAELRSHTKYNGPVASGVEQRISQGYEG